MADGAENVAVTGFGLLLQHFTPLDQVIVDHDGSAHANHIQESAHDECKIFVGVPGIDVIVNLKIIFIIDVDTFIDFLLVLSQHQSLPKLGKFLGQKSSIPPHLDHLWTRPPSSGGSG